MIFQNPWAWLGLLAIAGPIVAHWLARRPARRQPFPILRFLPAAAIKPVRRHQLADVVLLLVRCAVVAAAAVALTQPVWLSPDRARDLDRQVARAIIVDASASMNGATAGGGRAIDEARREATAVASDAAAARIVEATAPATMIAGAIAWLSTQPSRRELIVISDFQPSAMSRADVERIPADIGLRLITTGSTDATGATGTTGTTGTDESVRLLSGAAEHAGAAAARSAAIANGAPVAGRADHPTAVVFPQFEGREALLKAAHPLDERWMFDVWMRVLHDDTVVAAAARSERRAGDIVSATVGSVDGREHLLLVTNEPAHRLASAALIAAAMRAVADDTPIAEATPERRSADELRHWERQPAAVAPSGSSRTDASDGRWWWAAALVLLMLETVVRRTRPVAAAPEVPHARVA